MSEIQSEAVFTPNSWRKKIEFTKRLIQTNNILISVLGNDRCGKTTYASILKKELTQLKTCIVTSHPLINNRSLLLQIAAGLNIEGEASLNNFFNQINDQKHPTLLIIDDAHNLEIEFIEAILNEIKLQDKPSYFHICLISNYGILPKLKRLAENDYEELLHNIELGTLNEEDTKSYVIQQILSISGLDKMISEEKLNQFYNLTNGYLLKMNQHVKTFFADLEDVTIKPFGADRIMRKAVGGICLLLTIFVAASLFKQPVPAKIVAIKEKKIVHVYDPIDVSSFVPAYFDMAARKSIQNQASIVPKIILANAEKKEITKTVVNANNTPKKPPQIIIVNNKLENNKIENTKLDSKKYTIQLMGSYDKSRLQRFMTVYKIQGKIWAVHNNKTNKTWYVLTTGEFKENAFAHLELNKLPKDVLQYKPWIRVIENMQATG